MRALEGGLMRIVSRRQLIDELREYLLELVDDEHSMCEVAARKGIFCRGFSRLTDEELERRYAWLANRRAASRVELEDLANRWQLARQLVTNRALSCDVQATEHDSCRGWDEFSNDELAGFFRTLTGEPIAVKLLDEQDAES